MQQNAQNIAICKEIGVVPALADQVTGDDAVGDTCWVVGDDKRGAIRGDILQATNLNLFRQHVSHDRHDFISRFVFQSRAERESALVAKGNMQRAAQGPNARGGVIEPRRALCNEGIDAIFHTSLMGIGT